MPNKKFMVFYDDDLEPVIALAMTDFHRNIKMPSDFNPMGRAGGGWWSFSDDGELRLYGSSDDFGKYDQEMAQEAFDKGRVYYFDEPAMEDFGFTTLVME